MISISILSRGWLNLTQDKDKIERAFRNIKSFVEFNPVYVFKEEHVRTHYTICVPSYLLNLVITKQVKEARTTSLKSSSATMMNYQVAS